LSDHSFPPHFPVTPLRSQRLSTEELQEGSDRFRLAHGLDTPAVTTTWLRESRLSPAQFEMLIEENVKREKAKRALIEARIEAHFATHRDRFDTLTTCEATLPDRVSAERLLPEARAIGSLQSAATAWLYSGVATGGECVVRVAAASELPGWMADAPAGALLGPVTSGDAWLVAQILVRTRAAALDGATCAAVGADCLRTWMREQRERANIRWHWL
jgi:hypothetical protein